MDKFFIPKLAGSLQHNIPYRGDPTWIQKDEPQESKPQIYTEPEVCVFDLSDPKQIEAYRRALEICANGRGLMGTHEKVYDQEQHTYKVLFTYFVQHYEAADVVKTKKLNLA